MKEELERLADELEANPTVLWETVKAVRRLAARCPPEAPSGGDGWVMVPKVATEAMEVAGNNAAWKEDLRWNDLNTSEVWEAMLAAAPKQESSND